MKYIDVGERVQGDSGLLIASSSMPEIKAGDRITITGRVGNNAPLENWGIALFLIGGTGTHLTQHVAPEGLYSLTHLVDQAEVDRDFYVRTVQWEEGAQIVDFFVDSILITRIDGQTHFNKDTRHVVYSLMYDNGVYGSRLDRLFESSAYLMRAGVPDISIKEAVDGARHLHIGARSRDWDSIDVLINNMNLQRGNAFRLRVVGRLSSSAPDNSEMHLQGVPGYAIRSIVHVTPGEEFELEHMLTQAEVETWTSIRISTNSHASQYSFIIYSIEIRAEGLINQT